MTDLDSSKPLFESSVKLCAAVKKHKCLHDQKSYHKSAPPECEEAWKLVAKECNETVDFCKYRWKTLRRCFFDGLKRRGNKYYLHDHLKFLLKENKKESKRNSIATFNDETNSTISLQESEGKGTNVYDDEDDTIKSCSSQTTSADESNENIRESNQAGVFIINEFDEDAFEDDSLMDERRLSYKRSCKRALDPHLIEQLADDEPEEKRSRKSDKHNPISQVTNKSVTVRLDKLKRNPTENKLVPVRGKMVDRFTYTDTKQTRDFGTQYELNSADFDGIFMQSIQTQLNGMNARQKMNFKRKIYQSLLEVFDDGADFPKGNETLPIPSKQIPYIINTTNGELRLMRELVALVQAAKNTPEIVNAKEKIKTSTPIQNKTPLKTPLANVDNRSKPQTSPLTISPSPEDDDLQMFIDNIDDEDDGPLPRSWDEIKSKTAEPIKTANEDNIGGLPRHILQKVVRVSGSGGSTIVTRDGDKKRIYRVFPKLINSNANNTPQTRNDINSASIYLASTKNLLDGRKDNGVGTFYVTSNKNTTDTAKPNNNIPGITVRALNNKSTNTITQTTNPNQPTSSNSTNNSISGQTSFKNVHPANRILSSTTGYFKMVPSTKPASPTLIPKASTVPIIGGTNNATSKVMTNKFSVNSMMPPAAAAATAAVAPKRVQGVRLGSQIVQRRYSICGPPPADKAHVPSHSSPVTASKMSTNNGNLQVKSSFSQIQISQPISLNANAIKTQASSNAPNVLSNNSAGKLATNDKDVKIAVPSKESVANKRVDAPTGGLASTSSSKQREEIPILETAGTVEADDLDPLFVKPDIKSEPIDD